MKNNFCETLFINFGITLLTGIGTFIINRYFIIYLGIENLGIMKLFTQLLAYLNFAELGLVSASAYALYKPLSEKNIYKISLVVSTISSLYKKLSIFILITGLAITPFIPFFFKIKIIDNRILFYWILYVINSALTYSFVKYSILMTADQLYQKVRIIQGFCRICTQVTQLFCIIYLKSFLLFISLFILENMLQFLFFSDYYKKNYSYIFIVKEKEHSITQNLKNLFWHKLAALVVQNTDLILISKFISLEVVGIYSSYFMVVQLIILIIDTILNVLKPIIGKFIAENSKEDIYFHWRKSNIFFLFLAIFFTGITYLTLEDFIILWLGKQYLLPSLTTILFIVNLFILSFRGLTEIFKEGNGFFDDIHLPIFESLINFVVSLILVHFIGLNGIIIGTICSNISIVLIAKPILVFRRCFDKNVKEYIINYFEYLAIILICTAFIFFIKNNVDIFFVNSWLKFIEKIIFFSFLYLPFLLLIFSFNKIFRNNFWNIIKKVGDL